MSEEKPIALTVESIDRATKQLRDMPIPSFPSIVAVEKPQQAVVAYIRNEEGKLLSCRTPTRTNSAPGGKVESEETNMQALIREVREETGLHVLGAKLVYEGLHTSGRRVHCYLVESDCYLGEPVAHEPNSSLAWVDPEDIANGFGAEFHREALRAAGILKA